ncbi:MAG: S8 family serine peptidase [Myxococcota bacterium]
MRSIVDSTLILAACTALTACDAPSPEDAEDLGALEVDEPTATAPLTADRQAAAREGRLDPALVSLAGPRSQQVLVVHDAPELQAAAQLHASLNTREALLAADDHGTRAWLGTIGGLRLENTFSTMPVVVATVDGDGLDALLADPRILRVEADPVLNVQLSQAMALIDVPEARSTYDVDGSGVVVAVFDTGVDADHGDLADALVDEICFCTLSGAGCCPDGTTEQLGDGSAADDNGHGSHVSGIMVGSGNVAPTGAAPGSSLIAAKVQGASGSGSYSNLLLGLEWVALNRPETDIINMSVGAFSTDCFAGNAANTLTADLAQTLRAQGTTLFAASGNEGSTEGISLPACIDEVISVGAVYDSNFPTSTFNYPVCSDATPSTDQVGCFSNATSDLDLLAPGARVISADESGGTENRTGTSQAGPAAAGCAALLREHDPGLSPDQILSTLASTGVSILDTRLGESFPRVDCDAALAAADSDDDGTPTASDGCPDDGDKTAAGVCGCGTPDTNSDSDSTPDCNDGCPDDGDKTEPGLCGCGTPDTNSDSDSTPDCSDGCPDDGDKTEPGLCGCGTPDTNSDSDSTPDCNDGCPDDGDKTEPGECGCGVPDTNSDTDAVPDCLDGCPADGDKTTPGLCGCGVPDTNTDSDALPDCLDGCPTDPDKTEPGLCGCGTADTNSETDSIPDCLDGCPADGDKTEPGLCGCGVPDTNSDTDSTPDCNDGCPNDGDKTEPGLCGCGVPETDTDDDDTPDCLDACPDDPNKTEPGACGCGVSDVDADEDGVATCVDACPGDPQKTEPGACGCGVSDVDTDADDIPDCDDPCILIPDSDACEGDHDGDGASDGLDDDIDDDGIPNDDDNCVWIPNSTQENADGDPAGDACDPCPDSDENDADGDGVCDPIDNCPALANPDLADLDGDGVGDLCSCETNGDADTHCDEVDNCPDVDNEDQANADGDALGDACDPCPDDANNDVDADDVCGDVDSCPGAFNPDQADGDGDDAGDVCDVQDVDGSSSGGPSESTSSGGDGDTSTSSGESETATSTGGDTTSGPTPTSEGAGGSEGDDGAANDDGSEDSSAPDDTDGGSSGSTGSATATEGGCRTSGNRAAPWLLLPFLGWARRRQRRSSKLPTNASGDRSGEPNTLHTPASATSRITTTSRSSATSSIVLYEEAS